MLANGVILALLLGYAAWAVRRMLRRRGGAGPGCGGCSGGGCSGCAKGRAAAPSPKRDGSAPPGAD